MTKPIPYLAVGLGLAAASTAALAATFGMLRLAPVKTTREVLNLFASDKPVGGENAVPTVFVFSNDSDRSRYSHVGAQQIKTSLNLEFRQVCAGGGWKQYRIPHVHVGDQQWPSAGDGKPIVQPDGALYKATLTVASGKLELNPDLDPVKRCNAVIAAHTVNGKLPADLLGKGFWVRSEDGLKARIAPGCVKPAKCVGFCEDQYAGRETKWLPVWINCQPTGYVTTHRLPPEPHRTKPEAQRLAGALRDVSLAAVN
ncbi:MAG TPA: hypothetical protein VNJ05_10650, partial [Sphingomicrobium sp.]|nr:hypothetical protein [Sphingomicrobium sp.]